MYHDNLNKINENQSIFTLLSKLRDNGFAVEYKPEQQMSPEDISDAWQEFDNSGAEAAVSYLETMHGFIFGEGV